MNDARETMENDIRKTTTAFDLPGFSDAQIFALWSLIVSYQELWYHASPHHHREISQRIYNGKIELGI